MKLRVRFALLAMSTLAACAAPEASERTASGRPLDTLPGGFDAALARRDLLDTARERFGPAALGRAMATPTHLVVKSFAGMAPPPPPGAGPDWRAPTPAALLIREAGRWHVATPDGWRDARAEGAAELDALLAEPGFWTEPAFTPACPDFGARLLLLKLPSRRETVRNAQCTSRTERVVSAALRA